MLRTGGRAAFQPFIWAPCEEEDLPFVLTSSFLTAIVETLGDQLKGLNLITEFFKTLKMQKVVKLHIEKISRLRWRRPPGVIISVSGLCLLITAAPLALLK